MRGSRRGEIWKDSGEKRNMRSHKRGDMGEFRRGEIWEHREGDMRGPSGEVDEGRITVV